jgi:hypothetical protein
MSQAKTTRDHDTIRAWAEARGGHPASVNATKSDGEAGILRLDFEPADENLSDVSWPEFFRKFDREKLSFLYQERTDDGKTSRFHKFIRE